MTWKNIVFISVSIVFEFISFYLLFSYYPSYSNFSESLIIIFHFLASLSGAISIYYLGDKKKSMTFPFAFIFILSLSIFGYVGIFEMLFDRKSVKSSNLYNEYRQYILSGTKIRSDFSRINKAVDYLRNTIDLQPLQETIKDEATFTQKLNIIKTLGKIPGPDTIKILKGLLYDSNMNVRYYAGEELARLGEVYNVFINELNKSIKDNPLDYRLYLDLGRVIIDYSFSGLIDNINDIMEELKNALEALGKSLDLNSNQYEANFLCAKVYLYFRNYDKAIDYLNNAMSKKENDMPVLISLTECYWHKKDFINLENCIKKIETQLDIYDGHNKDQIKDFIESWQGVNVR